MITGVRRLFWRPDGRFEIHGWAYLDNVDLSRTRPRITLLLTDLTRPDQPPVEVLTVRTRDPEVTARSKHQHADYERGTFRATVDPARLTSSGPRSRWSVQVRVEACGLEGTAPLKGLQRTGSAGHLPGRLVPAGQLRISSRGHQGLVLRLTPPLCTVEHAELTGRSLTVALRPQPGFEPDELQLHNDVTGRRLQASVRRSGLGFTSRVEVPNSLAPTAARQSWTVRVRGTDGRRGPVATHEDEAWAGAGAALRLRMTQFGNLGLVEDHATLLVRSLHAEGGERLVVSGRWYGPDHRAQGLRLQLAAAHGSCSGPVEMNPDGTFRATLDLTADPWGSGRRPLRSGDYAFTTSWRDPGRAQVDRGPDEPAGEVRAEYPVVAVLPLAVRSEQFRGELQLVGSDGLRLHVEPPLRDDERGARHQRVLGQRLEDRRRHPGFERGAVLFRSYYGEVCGCNPLAVHQELRRRGTSHTLYWAVRDHSVAVPEDGIPVVHESAEWYRLLHDAEFYFDNMHQPIYHRKPAHQIQIQSFHGYPFKAMGQSHWRYQRRDVAHVRTYLDRAADWDYLVSPASYATELLRAEFGFPNEMLPIGYPRNDVLQSPRGAVIRDQVRARLGIRPDQTVVLYAPTFRDHLARNDFQAAMTDFLDVPALAGSLGDDFVVLVRGHAFHARVAARIGSRGNVVDVTDHPDINQLCLASDCAVLDYSSLRFDYGLTGKPMVYLVPDLDEYVGRSRGTLFAYEPTAPGPLVGTTDAVAEAVSDLPGLRRRYAEPYAAFRRQFLDLDDGHATERLVETVFLQRGAGARPSARAA